MTDQNSQFFAILTNVGAAKLANANALGIPWKLTHMGVGDGHGTDPIPSATQTALIGEWRRAPLNQLKTDPKNPALIIAEQVIPAEAGGFWLREIGLYDADGDLVAVANCAPSFKPLLNQGSGRTQIVRMNLVVSSSSNVELKIDPSVVLATRGYVDESIGKSVVQATEEKAGIAKVVTQPIFDGGKDDTAFVTAKKLFAGIFKAIGFTPVQQGGGAGQFSNKIRIGFDGSKVNVAVDETDMGRIITDQDAATESAAGVAKRATQPLADEGKDDQTFLTPKKFFSAIFKAIGFTPVEQGGGPGQLTNKIRIGFDKSRVRLAVDSTDMGRIVTDKDEATEDTVGAVMRATQPLTDAGVDDKTYVTPKKLFGSIFKAIGYTPVRQGGGVGQLDNKISIGFRGSKVGLTVDTSDFGDIITDLDKASQAATNEGADDTVFVTPKKMRWGFQFIVGLNGAIVFPAWMGGFILQWGSIVLNDGTSAQVTFPVQFTASRLATWSGINLNIAGWAGTVPGTSTSGGANTLANMVVAYNDNGGVTGVPVSWFALGK